MSNDFWQNAFGVCLWILRVEHHFDLVSLSWSRWRNSWPRVVMRVNVCMWDHVSCSHSLSLALCVCVWGCLSIHGMYFRPTSKYINMSLSSYQSNCFCFIFFHSFIHSSVCFGSFQLGSLFFHSSWQPCVPYEFMVHEMKNQILYPWSYNPKWWQIRYEHNISHLKERAGAKDELLF